MTDSKAVPGPRERGSRDSGRSDKRTSPTTFYRQVVAELRKVVWPTQEQLVTYFIVVMIFVVIMMTIVSLLDLGLGKLAFAIFDGRSAE
ncbi:preprotein translocase subunit SecE [Nocardioides halotolerans]|uniref:preprotein translocase subunit SecE n=1 Tax=Nocardioides halotolerans TaxID=433660 RepID=UPI0004269132|nr:preprotein translocase subunit SecE [Nocardioides halotolerans]